MTDREMRTVDIRPADGWRIARITPDGCHYKAMPGWLIQEEVTYDGTSGETTGTTGFRYIVAGALVGTQLEAADQFASFWQVVGPGEPEPTNDDIALEMARRYADGILTTRSTAVPCPACKKQAQYARELDLYVHLDGSENSACWRSAARGEVTLPARPRNAQENA